MPRTQTKGQLLRWCFHWSVSTTPVHNGPGLLPDIFNKSSTEAKNSRWECRHLEPWSQGGKEETKATEKRLRGKKELWTSLKDDNTEDDLSMGLSPHGAPWFSYLGPPKSLLHTLLVPLLSLRWVTVDTTDCRSHLCGHVPLTHGDPQPRVPLVSNTSNKEGVGRGWIYNWHNWNKPSTQKWWIRNRIPCCCLFKTFSLK